MSSGRGNQLTKQTGEYLVCAELSRMGFISTTFAGNIPAFVDIIAVNDELRAIPIQVKTIKKGKTWQLDAKQFINIEIENGKQKVKGKVELPNLIFIFVRLKRPNSQETDEFYICKIKDLQNIIYKNYTGFLKKKEGRRPKNPNSTHCTVSIKDLKKYKDNWDLLFSF